MTSQSHQPITAGKGMTSLSQQPITAGKGMTSQSHPSQVLFFSTIAALISYNFSRYEISRLYITYICLTKKIAVCTLQICHFIKFSSSTIHSTSMLLPKYPAEHSDKPQIFGISSFLIFSSTQDLNQFLKYNKPVIHETLLV
jgi:hypothetical protein